MEISEYWGRLSSCPVYTTGWCFLSSDWSVDCGSGNELPGLYHLHPFLRSFAIFSTISANFTAFSGGFLFLESVSTETLRLMLINVSCLQDTPPSGVGFRFLVFLRARPARHGFYRFLVLRCPLNAGDSVLYEKIFSLPSRSKLY